MTEIWNDADVTTIYAIADGSLQLQLGQLHESNRRLVAEFIAADGQAGDLAPAATFISACCMGVTAFEDFDGSLQVNQGVGWKKFLLFMTACNVGILWSKFRASKESAIFADWVTVTIERSGWGPDGGVSALGRAHSQSMAVASQAGGGVQIDPATGRFEAPTGDMAREYTRSHCS